MSNLEPSSTSPTAAAAGEFARRHIGIDDTDQRTMLDVLGIASVDELISHAIPASILQDGPLADRPAKTEPQVIERLDFGLGCDLDQ